MLLAWAALVVGYVKLMDTPPGYWLGAWWTVLWA